MSDEELNNVNNISLTTSSAPIGSSVCSGIPTIASTATIVNNDMQRTHPTHYVQQDQTQQQQQHNGEYNPQTFSFNNHANCSQFV